MSLRYRNLLLLVKKESQEGVDAAPDKATDAIAIANVTGPTANPSVITDDTITGGLDQGEPIMGAMPYEIGFSAQLKGSGTPGTDPEIGPTLEGCSYKKSAAALHPASGTTAATSGTTTSVVLAIGATNWPTDSGFASGMIGRVLELSGNPATKRLVGILDYQVNAGNATITFTDTLPVACDNNTLVKAPVGVLYVPDSDPSSSLTAYIYRDGLLTKLLGMRGDVGFTFPSGQRANAQFTLRGFFSSKTDVAVPADPTFQSTRPPVWRNALPGGSDPAETGAFTINSKAAAVQQLTLQSNNQIITPDNPNQIDGLEACIIMSRDLKGTFNPLETLVATRDLTDSFRKGTYMALHARLGIAPGNRIALTIPKAIASSDTPEDRNGILGVTIGYTAGGTADERAILFFY